ncbi:MAG: AI-2E family transporter [Lachnospiraceae bacterium]|nr:AI-2E family transporter [Lachnospiraceae bacterium]
MENKDTRNKVHKFEANRKYFTICIYSLFVILVALIMWKLLYNWDNTVNGIKKIISILSPFIVGAFIAFMLSPMNIFFRDTFFAKKLKIKSEKLQSILAIIVTYTIFIGVVTVLIIFIIPQVGQSVSDLVARVPGWYTMAEEYIINFSTSHPELDFIDFNKIIASLKETNLVEQVVSRITNVIPNIIAFLLDTSINIVRMLFNLLIAIIVSIYILFDKKHFKNGFRRLLYAIFPRRITLLVVDILKESHHIFSGFLFGKVVDSIIMGLLCFIAMTLLQLDYPILISVIVGITNVIPYFGPYIGGVIGALILLIVSPVKMLIFGVLILALQQFDGLYLGPKILGDSIGIKPIWIIFSVTVGGSLCGVLGMFLGVPVVAVIVYIINRIVDYRLETKRITFDENNTDLAHHIKKKMVENESNI